MDSCIRRKDYDTPFGDIIHHILSNALYFPILTVQQCGKTFQVLEISQREKYTSTLGNYLLVFERGNDYSGMTISMMDK